MKEMKYVKQKLLAGFLTAILTVTAIPAWNITNVQAKETDSKYSTSSENIVLHPPVIKTPIYLHLTLHFRHFPENSR